MKILVAEGDPVVRARLHDLLAEWGFDVVLAHDGEQACSFLQAENGPHLAILDWMTSGISGVELWRQIRASSRAHYVYILLLTARNDSHDVVMGMEAGADDY